MTQRNTTQDEVLVISKRDTTSPTTIIAQNIAGVNQCNVAGFIETLEGTDMFVPKFKKVFVDIVAYCDSPCRMSFFLAESFEGAGLADANGLDDFEIQIIDNMFSLEPFEVAKLGQTRILKVMSAGYYFWTGRIDITKYIKRWYHRSVESSGADWTNLNLLVLSYQPAAEGSTSVTSWLQVEYVRATGHPALSLVP